MSPPPRQTKTGTGSATSSRATRTSKKLVQARLSTAAARTRDLLPLLQLPDPASEVSRLEFDDGVDDGIVPELQVGTEDDDEAIPELSDPGPRGGRLPDITLYPDGATMGFEVRDLPLHRATDRIQSAAMIARTERFTAYATALSRHRGLRGPLQAATVADLWATLPSLTQQELARDLAVSPAQLSRDRSVALRVPAGILPLAMLAWREPAHRAIEVLVENRRAHPDASVRGTAERLPGVLKARRVGPLGPNSVRQLLPWVDACLANEDLVARYREWFVRGVDDVEAFMSGFAAGLTGREEKLGGPLYRRRGQPVLRLAVATGLAP